MRPALSTDETTGSSCFQVDNEIGSDDFSHDISYREALECVRDAYERRDDPKPRVVTSPEPMAEISWTTADVMRRASDTAFALEAHRRGMVLVGAKNILSGKYHDSGKKKHVRKSQKRGN